MDSATFIFFCSLISIWVSQILPASVIEDLNNLHPPPDFNTTISNNCFKTPSQRYCNSSPIDLPDIFKSTIVASHLCNESKNSNCIDSFLKIDLRNRSKIARLYLSFTFFWKYCPLTILTIDLSNNSIEGAFPSDILHCSQIEALDLSHNNLIGDIPLQGFSPLTNLTLLNLSYNHFSESKISDKHFFERFNSSSFLHSGLLPNHQKFQIKAESINLHRTMLKAATDGFSEGNLVGKSEGVDIYRGLMREGTDVRIEVYTEKISGEVHKKFVEECRILVQMNHKNLVRVLGWCNNRRTRAIVTEWTDGMNIETWLSSESPPWKHRLKILMGVLEGMCYLQEQWAQVGYDLRTCSVLLSRDLEPLISRFRIGDRNSSTKNVYRFGLFLLELVANRRPQEEFEKGEMGFLEWIKMHYPRNVEKVMDDRMKKKGIAFEQATQGIGLALMCTDLSSGSQPSLFQISDMITRIYESSLVSASPIHKRSHGKGGEGH
ncbi:hypothetical protein HHK36_000739 [Tetracentron sinense]|uniref:non-specific serine/threonine protein kinase n=1 Tax=Tetracentron sinense TaxID=13715 RepID=A0A834ZRL2_TETSI|nr:hypothetical protein HHK36_000739 [Tetracentron sinense]